MLRPPDRNPRIRKQECQIGEVLSPVDPPTCLETQQYLYDVAEADVSNRCRPLAFLWRQHDLFQERNRCGEDHGVAVMHVAVDATDHDLPIGSFDGRHGRAEMNRDAVVAALRRQKIDESAVAAGNASLRTPPATHPFVAKRHDAGPLRVGRIVALDHTLDGMP
jgi:hypothetical protein